MSKKINKLKNITVPISLSYEHVECLTLNFVPPRKKELVIYVSFNLVPSPYSSKQKKRIVSLSVSNVQKICGSAYEELRKYQQGDLLRRNLEKKMEPVLRFKKFKTHKMINKMQKGSFINDIQHFWRSH